MKFAQNHRGYVEVVLAGCARYIEIERKARTIWVRVLVYAKDCSMSAASAICTKLDADFSRR